MTIRKSARKSALIRNSGARRNTAPRQRARIREFHAPAARAFAFAFGDDEDLPGADDRDDVRGDRDELQWPEAESERHRDDFADELAAAWAGDQISARRTSIENDPALLDRTLSWNDDR